MATKYQVISHITHDKKAYPEGSTIELDDGPAKPLLDLGRIAPAAVPGRDAARQPIPPRAPDSPADPSSPPSAGEGDGSKKAKKA